MTLIAQPVPQNDVFHAQVVARGSHTAENLRSSVRTAPLLRPGWLVERVWPAHINGTPGVLSYLYGRPHSAFTLDIADGRICNMYI